MMVCSIYYHQHMHATQPPQAAAATLPYVTSLLRKPSSSLASATRRVACMRSAVCWLLRSPHPCSRKLRSVVKLQRGCIASDRTGFSLQSKAVNPNNWLPLLHCTASAVQRDVSVVDGRLHLATLKSPRACKLAMNSLCGAFQNPSKSVPVQVQNCETLQSVCESPCMCAHACCSLLQFWGMQAAVLPSQVQHSYLQ